MRVHLRRHWHSRLLVVLGVLALALSACGGGDDDAADASGDDGGQQNEAPATDAGGEEAVAPAILAVTADMVSGPLNIPPEERATAVCVLQSRYPRNSEVVWRVRVTDPMTGEDMDESMLEGVTVTLADGQTFDLRYGPHPRDNPNDFFWTAAWDIPADYPSGTVGFEIVATSVDGVTGTFKPFDVAPSLLTVTEEVLETIEES